MDKKAKKGKKGEAPPPGPVYVACSVPDLVDHLEGCQMARPSEDLGALVAAVVDAKKPESAGGKNITKAEWEAIGEQLAQLGVSVSLAFLDGAAE